MELRDPLGSLSIYGEVPPKIAYGPDGTLYAAYLVSKVVPGMRWPQHALRFAVSRDGGAHWDTPTTVTGDSVFGSYDDHALQVAPDGTIYLSWLAEAAPDTSHTYFARSTDRGKTWSAPRIIDQDRSCPCCRTAMASGPNGAVYVAWRKRFPGDERDIVVAKSMDRGATWGAPVRVHVDAWQVSYCPDAGPSIKVGRDGTVHMAWWTGREGRAGTQYAQSRDGGATYSRRRGPGAWAALARGAYPARAGRRRRLGRRPGGVGRWDPADPADRRAGVARRRTPFRGGAGSERSGEPGRLSGCGAQARRRAGRMAGAVARRSEGRLGGASELDWMDPRTHVHPVGAMQIVVRSASLATEATR